MGPSSVIAKQGEYGAVLVSPEGFFSLPAFPLENVVDPTGAGDTFAGGVVGYVASQRERQVDHALLSTAMAYGTAIASFNVEEFGTERVARLGFDEVNARVAELHRIDPIYASIRRGDRRMSTTSQPKLDFKVADLSLAEFGRKEIRLAEHEMPGLMATRREFGDVQAAGWRADHGLAAHDDPDGGADRDAGRAGCRGALGVVQHLLDPGSRRRGCCRRPDGTPEDPRGVPVYAWKGETLEEYWWCTEQALNGFDGGPNMILDDGGDATLLVHNGRKYELAGAVPDPRPPSPRRRR